METEPKKNLSRRQFIADAIGFGLLGGGIGAIVWGTSDLETITRLERNQLAQAHQTINQSITVFERHAQEGTLDKITEDIDEKQLQEAIKLRNQEMKQIQLEAQLRTQKHVAEKLLTGVLGTVIGATRLIYKASS